jgi:hypothetical protein
MVARDIREEETHVKSARKVAGTRHNPRLRPRHEDSYRSDGKPADPVACPRCRATFRAGRWSWRPAPPDATRHTCPACRRLEDNFPAGQVTLKGPFFDAHRDEILALVNARAERALEEHPLQRIIGVTPSQGGVLVTTTDPHLARTLGMALQSAYKGELDLWFSDEESFVRVAWTR